MEHQIVENSRDCAVVPYSLKPNNIPALARQFGDNANARTVSAVIRALQAKGGWFGLTEDEVLSQMPSADQSPKLRELCKQGLMAERAGQYFVTHQFVFLCLRAG